MVVPFGVGIWVKFSSLYFISGNLLGGTKSEGVGRYLAADLARVGSGLKIFFFKMWCPLFAV